MASAFPFLLSLLLLSLLPMLTGPGALAESSNRAYEVPSVYLDQANIPRAKALALDAALMKGWQVAVSAPDYSIFETTIREEKNTADGDSATIPVLLRIRAGFARDAGGVRVSLTATEIRLRGTGAESQRDVTDDYGANLHNALASLRRQWEDLALGGRRSRETESRSQPTHAVVRAPARDQPPPARGQWSYEAEQLARRHGCQVDDRGAILLGGRADSQSGGHEVYRVSCNNRSALMARCDSEGCRMGP
ncbi:hypothetical protein [Thiorhodovibrio frisius]|uniref:Uncharacterized protein n=1 Tax=Thiorhodovibrio frisius TaxID=631362 RepID=H8Z7S8_9GAMM|nr:hypothetical protein [Thiorhodovibrio frisius]EIC20940.1 hypothetical protein Thi970DRAFT_04619 [Thiorhodovibrio frisius]WPL21999.1 hypothetical protein Thiofri_02145 [Thiorhodovibrio frisius]